jgi:hypothetical protein
MLKARDAQRFKLNQYRQVTGGQAAKVKSSLGVLN